MNTLEEELRDVGYSDELVKVIKNAEDFNLQEINVSNVSFQLYENHVVSSTELDVTDLPTTCVDY